MGRFKQGRYEVQNPKKYKGNPHKVVYRSGWERDVFIFLDNSDSVVEWNSECVILPYFDSTKVKNRKYLVDVYVEFTNGKKYLWEIKPANKLIKPPNNKTNQLIEHINIMEKKVAAMNYCKALRIQGIDISYKFVSIIKGKFRIISP